MSDNQDKGGRGSSCIIPTVSVSISRAIAAALIFQEEEHTSMTAKQRLQLEQSEKRQKLNELLAIEDQLTDEQRSEMDGLTKRLTGTLEIELRAAIASEGLEESQAAGAFSDTADGEQKEIRSLLEKVRVTDYLSPAAAKNGVDGAAAELNAAFELGPRGEEGVIVPWQVLIGPEHETRALDGQRETRAFTSTSNNDGSVLQRPILQRLFGSGVLDALGCRLDSVPVGRSEWNLLTGTVAPDQTKEETAAAAATAASFTPVTLRPKKMTGVYEYTHEMAASVADIAQALRVDLGDAIKAKMSDVAINGLTPTTQQPQRIEGFLTAISEPGDASAVSAFQDYAGSHAQNVDGLHAEMETEVSSVIATDVYKHAASVYQAGSGESGSEALMRRSMSCRASSYIPLAVSMQSKGNLYHSAGPNGGGAMRGDSVGALWPSLEIVVDRFSKASQGVILTFIMLWDLKVALRSAAYSRQAFQLT